MKPRWGPRSTEPLRTSQRSPRAAWWLPAHARINLMTLRDLTQLVVLGEGQHLEFKHRVPRPERIAKEIIAFANCGGGRLLLGVGDDGTLQGVRDAEEEEFALRRALRRHSDPPVEVLTERVPISKKRDVILVVVPASPRRPHFLVNGGPEHLAYVRVQDMSVEASPEAVRLMRLSKHDDDVLFEFGEKEQVLMRYLDSYGRISVEQFASVANIPVPEASDTLVTLARASVLRFHTDAREDYFTLAYGG